MEGIARNRRGVVNTHSVRISSLSGSIGARVSSATTTRSGSSLNVLNAVLETFAPRLGGTISQ